LTKELQLGASGDVYELIDTQVQAGQKVLNVYFYVLDAIGIAGNVAINVVEEFVENVLPLITAWQCGDVLHTSVSARNLFDETEAHTELISEAGENPDSVLPPFNAVGFRLIGDNSAVHDGSKRYAGIGESQVSDGVITGGTVITALQDLGLEILASQAIGIDASALAPIIVKRLVDGSSYRLPTTQGEAVISRLIDVLFNVDVTSQTTRKIGRGE
jgi:hypothetical protein